MTSHTSHITSSKLVVAITCALLCLSALSAKTVNNTRPRGKRIFDTGFLDINRWHLPFYNDGRFAVDVTKTNFPGGYWPAPVKNFHLFGGGLWVGAISAANETLVTVGYNPNSGVGEFYPTIAANVSGGTGNSEDRVYKYGTNFWPPPRTGRFGTDTTLIPKDNFSLQDLWMAFSDAAPGSHVSPGKPLGLDVFLTVYAWNYPSNQDIFFLRYKVKNSTAVAFGTPTTLNRVYFGVCQDEDIGDATDDMVGMILERAIEGGQDTVRNVGFVGDWDNIEPNGSAGADRWQGGQPGIVAMKFLKSPAPGGVELGMTAFKKFTIDIDPVKDADQYLTMAGIDYRTGVYNQYDSIDEQKGDKRIIMCSGPFDLLPDSVQEIIIANIGCYYGAPGELWPDRTEDDLQNLITAAQSAQFIYDKGWLLPGPPESPNVKLIPGDNRVRVTWDNHSEVVPSKYYQVSSDTLSSGWDPLYKKFDFQGYKVYKSTNGTDWRLMTQCDLADQDTFVDTTQAESIRTKARDSGIFYSFVDDSVINGFTYYYSVSAYNHNYSTKSWTPETETLKPPHKVPRETLAIILEGGKRGVSVIPRWEAPNLIAPEAYVLKIAGDTVNPAALCSVQVVVPFAVTEDDTYELRFLEPLFVANNTAKFRWLVTNIRSGEVLVDTAGMTYQILDLNSSKLIRNDLPTVGGMAPKLKLRMGAPTASFGKATVVSGSYPAESIQSFNPSATGVWAFRGSDIRIVWHRTGDRVTADVYDVTNGNIPIPFIHYGTAAIAKPESANGYCFVNTGFRNASDSLRSTDAYLYCTGGYLALNKGNRASAAAIGPLLANIQDGDEWYVEGARANKSSPAYNVFRIVGKPETGITNRDTFAKYSRLEVRVVPNPYVITNNWELASYNRRLAFTGLPLKCKIRIYTQAGDLVKTIPHTATAEAVPGQPPPQPDSHGGTEFWDLINDNNQLVATGVYIFHIDSDVGEQVGKFAVVR